MSSEYRTTPVNEDPKTSYDHETLVGNDRRDVEKGSMEKLSSPANTSSDDPFGDESDSEVKYKVLKWW
jgi:hypothetical protein